MSASLKAYYVVLVMLGTFGCFQIGYGLGKMLATVDADDGDLARASAYYGIQHAQRGHAAEYAPVVNYVLWEARMQDLYGQGLVQRRNNDEETRIGAALVRHYAEGVRLAKVLGVDISGVEAGHQPGSPIPL